MRNIRQSKSLSQEQLAEAANLSLRTIQRVEAGHRVSYSSLRALAAALEINVDLLERELYAMNNPTDEFIEKPLWVRLTLNLPSLNNLRNADLLKHETWLVAYAIFSYASSSIIPKVEFPFLGLTTIDAMYFSAFSALFVAYIAAISLRLRCKFNTQENSAN